MTAARISPAASLLRNSKLFALPPAVSLPAANPSSEPVPRSETATSAYPTRAAIETPLTSLNRGDWGFKRALPLKSTTKSGTPVVRLNNGIDTAEHIADFDSAADHVLTLKKFQELNQVLHMPTGDLRVDGSIKREGVFLPSNDNTIYSSTIKAKYTGIWPNLDPSAINTNTKLDASDAQASGKLAAEQTERSSTNVRNLRWRFDGPSLTQLSGLEFERYLHTIDSTKRAAFLNKVKEYLERELVQKAQATARDQGTMGQSSVAEITSEDVTKYLRKLRQQPAKFGPLIAEFLDLPEGPERGNSYGSTRWEYGRQSLSSEYYRKVGLPRTHPSAGLSYIHNKTFSENHAVLGPQLEKLPSVARAVKTRSKASALRNNANFGLAGFIINTPRTGSSKYSMDVPNFTPTPGGQKAPVIAVEAEISEKGMLQMAAKPAQDYRVRDNKAVHLSMLPADDASHADTSNFLKRTNQRRVFGSVGSTAVNGMDYQKRSQSQTDQDMDTLLEDFMRTTRDGSSTV